jgi:hypothetical protein
MIRKLFVASLAIVLGIFPAMAAGIFSADSLLSVASIQVANNTTATVVSAVPATLYEIQAFNNSSTIAYIKIYNAASATCGSGTPQARYMIPASTAVPPVMGNTNGDAYGAGITVCVTTGYAESDTTAPAANEYILNLHYKKASP